MSEPTNLQTVELDAEDMALAKARDEEIDSGAVQPLTLEEFLRLTRGDSYQPSS